LTYYGKFLKCLAKSQWARLVLLNDSIKIIDAIDHHLGSTVAVEIPTPHLKGNKNKGKTLNGKTKKGQSQKTAKT